MLAQRIANEKIIWWRRTCDWRDEADGISKDHLPFQDAILLVGWLSQATIM